MSANDNEELIDYEDDHDLTTTGATTAENGTATGKDKKYAGIHSTGFR
jgi:ATP-dependent RNA helicase UAP56/SUB2